MLSKQSNTAAFTSHPLNPLIQFCKHNGPTPIVLGLVEIVNQCFKYISIMVMQTRTKVSKCHCIELPSHHDRVLLALAGDPDACTRRECVVEIAQGDGPGKDKDEPLLAMARVGAGEPARVQQWRYLHLCPQRREVRRVGYHRLGVANYADPC